MPYAITHIATDIFWYALNPSRPASLVSEEPTILFASFHNANKKRHTHSITPKEEMIRVGWYLSKVVSHEQLVTESLVAWNAKPADRRSAMPLLLAGFKFVNKVHQKRMLEIVVKNHLFYVRIIRLR